MHKFVTLFQQEAVTDTPPLDELDLATDQERRKMFLRYLSRGWFVFGVVTLAAFPFFPEQRGVFGFLIAVTFPTYLFTRLINGAGKTRLAGVVFTLLVNFSFYGLFLLRVRQIGPYKAFESEISIWMLMGLAVLFAGIFIDKWAAPGFALFNTFLLIGTRLTIAPGSDPRPSALVFWWMLALTVWLYERTLNQALGRLRTARGGLEDLVQTRTQTLEETVIQLEQAKMQLESMNKELEAFSTSISHELDESEARFQQIFQISPAPMLIVGDAGITDVNDALLQMTGYTRDELVGKKTVEVNLWKNPEDREKTLEIINQQGFLRDFELEFFRKSGEEGVAVVSTAIWKQPDGELRYLSNLLDYTERKRAEEALRASEGRLRMLLDNLGEGICVQDNTWHYTYANPAAHTILGWPLGELIGKSEDDVLPPYELARVKQENVYRIAGQITTYETDILRPNGEIRTVLATGVPRLDAQGSLIEIFVAFSDITDRKLLERELQEERDFVLQIINTMGQGLTVTDENGYFILVNPAAARLVGGEAQDWIGKRNRDVTAVDDLPILDKARESRIRGQSTTFELKLRHQDGRHVQVLVTGVPRYNGDTFIGFITIVTDLTEVKRVEQALRESEAQLQLALDAAHLGTWRYDFAQNRTFFSERLQMIYGGQVPSDSTEYMHPDDQMPIQEALRELLQKQQVEFSLTYRVLWPNGDIRWVESWGQVSYIQGHPTKLMGVARDVTERKQAEEEIYTLNAELEQRVSERTAELEAANKELEAFSYSVSHDLRAPLRAISGFSSVLADEVTPTLSEAHQRYLQLIRENVQRMSQLIDDLLAFSRLNRQPLQKRTVDLNVMTRDVLDELQSEFAGRQVDLSISDLPVCEADPALLRLVFMNLFSNALKYSRTRPAAKIEVGWVEQEEGQVFFVRDNGVGFDMQYADKLFGVFQRLHRQEDFEGTGVGLATVQRIIHRHGGRIWAEAEVDKGATFFFTI